MIDGMGKRMTDIHTHILPGIDDGATDIDTAKKMLETEYAQGVKTVVFTPHYYSKKSPSQFLAQRQGAFNSIKECIPTDMDVRLGVEMHFTGMVMPAPEAVERFAIQGTKYVLFEFPFTEEWHPELLERMFDLMSETDCMPLIAHAERYFIFQKHPEYISALVSRGCLIQVNAQSFTDRYEKKFAYALLKHGLIHCVASDAHDTDLRAPNLAEFEKKMIKEGYSKEWEKIKKTTARILAGERVQPVLGKPIRKIFGFYK